MGANYGKPKTEQASPSSQRPITAMDKSQIKAIEKILGYKFKNRKLVEEATIHPSYYYPAKAGITYERLEFLGDSVINSAVAKELFRRYTNLPQGPLTSLKAANVDNEKLARIAVGCGLYKFLRHNAPKLEGQISTFIKKMDQYPIHSNGLLETPKPLGDIVESLLGAVYVDSNFSETIVYMIFKRLAEPLITLDTLGKHPKSELNELCQKTGKTLKIDDKRWEIDQTVNVLVNGELVGTAHYERKKDICQNRAAKNALNRLQETLIISETQNLGGQTSLSDNNQENTKLTTQSETLSKRSGCRLKKSLGCLNIFATY